jgi:probable phosphoglycerate mutase
MAGSLFGDDPVPRADAGGWVNAHCDGGARGNPGPAGFGAVVADDAGHKLAEISDFLGVCTNNVAEYRGLLAVLDWTLAHGYGKLRVVSDSLLMVNQIKGKFKVGSPDLRPLWEQARQKIRELERFEISHALRHKNKDADRLANEAMDRGMGRAPAAERPAERKPVPAAPKPASGTMLRGFVRDGAVHLLGGASLPDGVFVKVIPE